MISVLKSNSPTDTEKIGFCLAEALYNQGFSRAFIALYGEMGVGKTAFTRGFASALGCTSVKSPTYTVVNEYRSGKMPIFHFDMYRIGSEDDLLSIGYDDYLERRGYAVCEWSERIPEFIPENAIRLTVTRDGDGEKRIITLDIPDMYPISITGTED